MEVVSRKEWGANPDSLGPCCVQAPVEEVFIHHDVIEPAPGPKASLEKDIAHTKKVESVGVSRFGRVSYSFGASQTGRIFELQGDHIGAHTAGRNSTSLAWVLYGNYTERAPTRRQLRHIGRHIRRKTRQGWIAKDAAIRPHRAVKATACPGISASDMRVIRRWARWPYVVAATRNGRMVRRVFRNAWRASRFVRRRIRNGWRAVARKRA